MKTEGEANALKKIWETILKSPKNVFSDEYIVF